MNSHTHSHLQIQPRESVREGIQRIAAALATLPTPPPVDDPASLPKAVHETRLALKRARAIVRLLRPSLGSPMARKLNQNLRAASHQLAEARDDVAGLDVLTELSVKRSAKEAKTLATIRASWVRTIDKKSLSNAQLNQGIRRAQTTLRSTAATLTKVPWKKRGWAILSAGIRSGHQRARRRFKAARKSTDPAVLHSWRTASKSLLYQLAILRPISKHRLERWTRDLDALQKSLGTINDLATLGQRLSKKPSQFGGKASVQSALSILQREQDRRGKDALKRGRRLLAEGSGTFLDRLTRRLEDLAQEPT
jgi:CHAD domain-containing protein